MLVREDLSAAHSERRSLIQRRARVRAERKTLILQRSEDRAALKRLRFEQREYDRSLKRLAARFQIRMKEENRKAWRDDKSWSVPLPKSRAVRPLPSYRSPFVDARGRQAVFFRVKYLGLKTKGYRPGLAADHARYILPDEAAETYLTNQGHTIDEVAAAWDALEEVETADRANAKLQYRIIANLPHELAASDREKLVAKFCKRHFVRNGLPFVAAIHRPDPDGDERNYHMHIIYSNRPMERQGSHEWSIATEKLTDLDGKRLFLRAQTKLRRSPKRANEGVPVRAPLHASELP